MGTAANQQGQHLVWRKEREFVTVLSYLCSFGNNDVTGLINNVIEDMASRKEVKRAIQDLAGEETYTQYIKSLHFPDWVLLVFKMHRRISGHTLQTVINITQLGRTVVSKLKFFIHLLYVYLRIFPLENVLYRGPETKRFLIYGCLMDRSYFTIS